MIYDPLYEILKSIGVSWWSFWLLYACADVIVNIILSLMFGGTKKVREFLKDPMSLMWPFFILGTVSGGYMIVSDIGRSIERELGNLGLSYTHYSSSINNFHSLYIVLIIFGLFFSVSTRIRYEKYRPNLWFNKPKIFGRIRTLLFDFPMGFMSLVIIVLLLDQWITLYNFLTSSWIPSEPFKADNFFGLRWVYNLLTSEITIVLILSLTPLLMMIREKKQKYSWIYTTLFTGIIIIISVSLFVLYSSFQSKISLTYSNFMEIVTQKIGAQTGHDTSSLLEQIVTLQMLSNLRQLPNKVELPNWLSGLISVRILGFIFLEVYIRIASKMSWPTIPKKIKPIISKFL